MNTHDLKCWPPYFAHVQSGAKPFEIRENDRNYQVGDVLNLREWDAVGGYTGQACTRTITYLTDFWQSPGYVVLGLAIPGEQHIANALIAELKKDLTEAEQDNEALHEENNAIRKNLAAMTDERNRLRDVKWDGIQELEQRAEKAEAKLTKTCAYLQKLAQTAEAAMSEPNRK